MKLCKNCRFEEGEKCLKDWVNPITGEKTKTSCINARKAKIWCGAEGKYWEKKDIPKPSLALSLTTSADGSLVVSYGGPGAMNLLAIDKNGVIIRPTFDSQLEIIKEWRKNGKEINDSCVEWRKDWYGIEKTDYGYVYLVRKDIKIGNRIYDFESMETCAFCNDPNIKRFEHNNRPI